MRISKTEMQKKIEDLAKEPQFYHVIGKPKISLSNPNHMRLEWNWIGTIFRAEIIIQFFDEEGGYTTKLSTAWSFVTSLVEHDPRNALFSYGKIVDLYFLIEAITQEDKP